jgi:hypothetical protein
VVNFGARGSVARPYWSTLKYPNYKNDLNLNVHKNVSNNC